MERLTEALDKETRAAEEFLNQHLELTGPLAQKRFNSKPLAGENGESFHVCLGSYTVDGKHAGYYARISESPRIDSNAADIPVLIERNGEQNER